MKDFLRRTDVKLVQFFAYVGSLIYLLLSGHGLLSVLYIHLFFVCIYGFVYFRQDFLIFFLAPVSVIIFPIRDYFLKRYLRNFRQNEPAEVVIVLGQSDWFKLEAWLKYNFLKSELESLVQYLKAKKQEFSFYTRTSFKDVKKIMGNKSIKEVYFFGHGNSHSFQLNTDEPLYYCDFNDFKKYGKEFVHQVHCGTPSGKSLVDYVVPKENRNKCFFLENRLTLWT
ncbi:MAG: hypothetical protein PHD72_02060 [Patescibacteria group bacterium]|nr:hypothetical protein [Patescibacteria group bacterium]